MHFTFLFITKGRYEFKHSLTRCIEQLAKSKNINIIIIDGNKDDRIEKFLIDLNVKDRIKVIKQTRGKFIRACLIGIENLNTEYFTFMHDDDYISPDFFKMVDFAIKYKSSVIGNGIVLPRVNDYFTFKKIEQLSKINRDKLLNSYFCSKKINGKFLPANPACSVFKIDVAKNWVNVIKVLLNFKFISNYFFYKNIGQDLLIYLIALTIQKEIYYYKDYSCQFSSHKDSMSVNFGSHNLGVGYWLAKKIYSRLSGNIFSYNLKNEEKINLFCRGFLYCLKQLFNNKKFRFHSNTKLLKEILNSNKIEINNIKN